MFNRILQQLKIGFSGVLLVTLYIPLPAMANWLSDTFIDPEDGYLDASNWLASKSGFLPVPIIITEPAVGYGGGLAAAFFHGELKGHKVEDGQGGFRRVPPSVSVVAAGKTENGTWFAGGGHMGVWKEDNIRYLGGLGYGSINMDYYGRGGQLGDRPVKFNTEALFLIQELSFRLWDSPVFVGAGYTFIDTQNRFNTSSLIPIPGLPDVEFDIRSAGLNLHLNYDTRNNIFTPSEGLDTEVKAGFYGNTWGGDSDFRKYSAYVKYYRPLGKKWVLGLRGDLKAVDGDAPFFEYPYIDMRGIKAMRYQGKQTALGEMELRWSFTPRWTLVGFGGAGRSFGADSTNDSDLIVSRGAGIRYLIASKLGLQTGIDVAWGPEETAIYIQVGSGWVK